MRLRVPPVLVFLIFSCLMYVLSRFLPFGSFDFTGRFYLSLFLSAFALFVGFFALAQFFRSRTTVSPIKPEQATKLVEGGIYAYTRNPMYLAMLLFLLALGAWLGNAFNVLLAAGFVAYMNRFQIMPEEEALNRIFGKQYRHYCIRVRRWF